MLAALSQFFFGFFRHLSFEPLPGKVIRVARFKRGFTSISLAILLCFIILGTRENDRYYSTTWENNRGGNKPYPFWNSCPLSHRAVKRTEVGSRSITRSAPENARSVLLRYSSVAEFGLHGAARRPKLIPRRLGEPETALSSRRSSFVARAIEIHTEDGRV